MKNMPSNDEETNFPQSSQRPTHTSSSFTSRTTRRIQKLTNSSTWPVSQFYISTRKETGLDHFSTTTTARTPVDCHQDTFTRMDVARKLRKYIRNRFNHDDGQRDADTIIDGDTSHCVDCEYYGQDCAQDTIRIEKKLAKLLRRLNSHKRSSCPDGRSYTILSLLLSQYHDHTPSVTECDSEVAPGSTEELMKRCQQMGAETTAENAPDLTLNNSMIRLFSCTISRCSNDDSFGLKCKSAKIVSVDENSPAAMAKLKVADRIIAVNGHRVEESDDVQAMMEDALEVKLVIERNEGLDPDEQTQPSETKADEKIQEPAPSRTRKNPSNDEYLEGLLERIRVYPRGTIMDRFPEARAFVRLMGKGTYSAEFRDCNI